MAFGEPTTDSFLQVLPPVDPVREAPLKLFAQIDLHTENNFFTGFAGGLEDGGLFITTYERVPMGARVRVDLSLPLHGFVTVEGRVIWRRTPRYDDEAPGVGIRLQGLTADARRCIEQFMQRREPTFVDPDLMRRESKFPPRPSEPPAAVADWVDPTPESQIRSCTPSEVREIEEALAEAAAEEAAQAAAARRERTEEVTPATGTSTAADDQGQAAEQNAATPAQEAATEPALGATTESSQDAARVSGPRATRGSRKRRARKRKRR